MHSLDWEECTKASIAGDLQQATNISCSSWSSLINLYVTGLMQGF